PRPTLFPYTTLFRSRDRGVGGSNPLAPTNKILRENAENGPGNRAFVAYGRPVTSVSKCYQEAGDSHPTSDSSLNCPVLSPIFSVDRKSTRLNSSHVE